MDSLCDTYGDVRVMKRLMATYLQSKDFGESEKVAFLYWTPRLLNTPSFYQHYKSIGILATVRSVYDERMEEVESRGDLELEIDTINSIVWLA